MTNPLLNIFAKNSLPDLNQREPYSLYFVAPPAHPDYVEIYATGSTASVVKRVINKSDIEALISNSSSVKVVADIPTRDNLTPQTDIIVLVLDASADPEVVDSIPATYIYNFDSSSWVRVTAGSSTTPQPVEFVEKESIILNLSRKDRNIYIKPRANIIPYLPYSFRTEELILKCDSAPIGSEIEANLIINSNSLIQEFDEGYFYNSESIYSVSLSENGSVMAIGSSGFSDDRGRVRIYQNVDGSWIQVGSDIDGEAADDYSGYSVSLSADGTVVAIGAYGNDGIDAVNNFNSNRGHVRVYQNPGLSGSWTQVGGTITGDIDGEAPGDWSGESVSLSADGSVVAIGARFNEGDGNYGGHVRIYRNVNGSWTQVGNDINGEAPYDKFGASVSLSADGSVVAIGAYFNDNQGSTPTENYDFGHVQVYQNPGLSGSWTQVGENIVGEAPFDYSGRSVSLSADGSVVAIGAIYNDGAGDFSGHVRVYQNPGLSSGWTQVGNDIDGEAAHDDSGWSVSLSADGSVVAIGAPFNDGNGDSNSAPGHARVYRNTNGRWSKVGEDIDGPIIRGMGGGAVALSRDGKFLAFASTEQNIIIEPKGPAQSVLIYKLPEPITMSISPNTTVSIDLVNKGILKGTNLEVDITKVGSSSPGQNLVLIINGTRLIE
jgi:hypothetical protein